MYSPSIYRAGQLWKPLAEIVSFDWAVSLCNHSMLGARGVRVSGMKIRVTQSRKQVCYHVKAILSLLDFA